MKEFKFVEGGAAVFCHVAYPYPQPGTVSVLPGAADFAWLEHALLFMFKTPTEFGAKLWKGVYFQPRQTDQGLDGRPQAVDLNRTSAAPDQPACHRSDPHCATTSRPVHLGSTGSPSNKPTAQPS